MSGYGKYLAAAQCLTGEDKAGLKPVIESYERPNHRLPTNEICHFGYESRRYSNVRFPPIADIRPAAIVRRMVELVYLLPGKRMPEGPYDEPWLDVEADDDGRFFGTGWGRKPSGESVFYVSLAENDATLEAAINAATEWDLERGISRIWVQATSA